MNYWLMKSEPHVFSIDDLKNSPKQTSGWEGVRNYQARNMMRDDMKKGDLVLFYHSSCNPPGIVGTAKIVREAYPDESAWNVNSAYYDPKSSPENPRWCQVSIQLIKKFPRQINIAQLRNYPELDSMIILRKGNRLSITPVTQKEYEFIVQTFS